MKLIMEGWRDYQEREELLEEALLLEQKLNEARATWGDLAKFVAGADPTTWQNRLKKYGGRGLKVAAGVGLTMGAVAIAPKIMAALGIAKAGPMVAQQLIGLMGDDVSTWTEDMMQKALEKIGTGIGTIISSKAIMGALDKITQKTPLSRLNITDTITNVVDKKFEDQFYTFMNQWFIQHPQGPNNNPDEVIPKRWADNMFSQWLTNKAGIEVQVKARMGGVQVASEQ